MDNTAKATHAVIEIHVPMGVSPEADYVTKLDAAKDACENFCSQIGDEDMGYSVSNVRFMDVDGNGEPAKEYPEQSVGYLKIQGLLTSDEESELSEYLYELWA